MNMALQTGFPTGLVLAVQLLALLAFDRTFAGDADTVALWRFDALDEKTGAIEDEQGGCDGVLVAQDIGSKENFLKPGLYGTAGRFDRGKWRVVVGHREALSLRNDFSVECVIKPWDVDSFKTILWKGSRKVSPEAINYYLDIRNGALEFKSKTQDGTWIVYASRKKVIEAGRWHHLFLSFKDGHVVMAVNGVECEVQPPADGIQPPAALVVNDHDLTIGDGTAASGQSGYSFDGLIDEVRIRRGTATSLDLRGRSDLYLRIVREQYAALAEMNGGMRAALAAMGGAGDTRTGVPEALLDRLILKSRALDALQEETSSANARFMDDLRGSMAQARYAALFSGNEAFAVAVLPAYERIVKRTNAVNDVRAFSRDIRISMARNEREGFQIYLFGNPRTDCSGIRVEMKNLVHENGRYAIPAVSIEWAVIESIETEKPDIPVDFVGWIPDVIVEGGTEVKVGRNDFTPVYVRIHADAGTLPGKYSGEVVVSQGDFKRIVNVALTVFDFVLPARNSLKIGFNFSEELRYKQWYGYKELSERQSMAIYDFLHRFRLPPTDKYSGIDLYPKPEYLAKLKDRGADFVSLKYFETRKKLTAPELSKTIGYYRGVIDKAREAGCFDSTYFHSFDELAVHRYLYTMDDVIDIERRFKKEFPGLKFIQSSYPTKELADLDIWNVWMIPFNFFATERAGIEAERKKPGREIWWYTAGGAHPFPDFHLDYPVYDCRIVMTLSYKYKVAGINYWCINREWTTNQDAEKKWPGTKWKPYFLNINTGKRDLKNGDGNLVYPGPEGRIYPSLRLENLRDGIEDYEYLALLERRLARHKAANPRDAVRIKRCEDLLAVPGNVAVAINDYSPDPGNLVQFREDVARAIEELADAPSAP